MNKIIVDLTLEGVFVLSLVAWLLLGLDGAGNLFKFIAWTLVVLALIQACSAVGKDFLRNQKRGPIRIAYMFVRNLAVLCICAWLGLYFLAAMWAFSWALVIGARASKTEVQS